MTASRRGRSARRVGARRTDRDDGAHRGLEAPLQPVGRADGDQLLDRMSYKRFCGLESATNIPDRTTVWTFENRIGKAGAEALFDGVAAQLLKKGFIARGGQIIDATLVPALTQHNSRGREGADRSGGDAGRLETRQAAPEGHRRELDPEALQEPLRLQAPGRQRLVWRP